MVKIKIMKFDRPCELSHKIWILSVRPLDAICETLIWILSVRPLDAIDETLIWILSVRPLDAIDETLILEI